MFALLPVKSLLRLCPCPPRGGNWNDFPLLFNTYMLGCRGHEDFAGRLIAYLISEDNLATFYLLNPRSNHDELIVERWLNVTCMNFRNE